MTNKDEALKLALDDLIAEYHMEQSSFAKRVDDIFKQALAAPVQEPFGWYDMEHGEIQDVEWTRQKPTYEGNWRPLYTTPPAQPAPVQEPVLKPLSKKWKWVLHKSFADVAGFDEEGIPSFYWKESVTKFKSGELSVPCKGKNCGSLNGWLHSAECRAEHEAQYTTPPAAQQAPSLLAFAQNFLSDYHTEDGMLSMKHYAREAQAAIDSVAAQPAPVQEPDNSAFRHRVRVHLANRNFYSHAEFCDKLEALLHEAPPAAQRQWVGLTNDEIDKTHETQVWDARRSYARAIEAKLKEKNDTN